MADATSQDGRRRGSRSTYREYEQAVAMYTAAGGEQTVQRVVTAISRIDRGFDVYYRQQFRELGLSHGEWIVLAGLAQEGRGGTLTPGHLADVAAVSPSTMTHRLDRMAERGLLERSHDPSNRTRTKVALTRAGWELFRRVVTEADVIETRALAQLSAAERRTLAGLLERVVAELP